MKLLPIIERAGTHGDALAIREKSRSYTYHELLTHSERIASIILYNDQDLNEARIAYLIPPGFDYVTTQWAIWQAGGIAVPLSLSATDIEWEYTLTDSQADCVVTTPTHADKIASLCERLQLRHLVVNDAISPSSTRLPEIDLSRRAMILYTSGTTSKPKGVVTTHACIQAQIESLIHAWHWQSDDSIPLFLPLHHIHGIINIMSCALWMGATIDAFPRFDMDTILQRVADQAYTVFMAVPTIYVKMIHALEVMTEEKRAEIVEGFQQMRLMVSGSAALPASIHGQWETLTGQKLLERYGMTEIGMGLSNPYDGERRPGAVGQPLPSVEIRLQSENGETITEENQSGEIQVRGPNVFLEYWNKPEATSEAFQDGWFRTGDIAVIEHGYYRIMGRSSVDIIKSGGYKLSALEIESVLLEHHAIRECAVVGIADDTWGEIVAVAVVLSKGNSLSIDELTSWCQSCLSSYKIPRRLSILEQLPRNTMGKVTKPAIVKLFTENESK